MNRAQRESLGRLDSLVLIVLLLLSAAAGCSSESIIVPIDHPALPQRGFFMGILPTPSEGESFAAAYERASALAECAPVWGRPTPFYQLAQELSGGWGHTFVEQYIRGNGMFPIINLSFIGADMQLISPPDVEQASLQNPEWRASYIQAALDVVRAVKPLYLSLGNEVNRWYEHYGASPADPNGFRNYISLYNEIYDAVKQLSPQTTVFCTFAREIVSQNREADLTVLSMFDPGRLDMLVFTSYPYAVAGIHRPDELPDDYYARATGYISGKPFGMTEVGWAALDAFGGEQGQADFIREVAGRLTVGQGLDLRLLGWPWLTALDENDPIALVRRDGSERVAYSVWQNLFISGAATGP